MDDQKAQVKDAATAAAKEEGTKVIEKAVKGTEAEKVVKDILGGGKTQDSTKVADTTKTAPTQDAQKQVEDEAKKKIQNLLKKKKVDQ